jgi:hypothetical protein
MVDLLERDEIENLASCRRLYLLSKEKSLLLVYSVILNALVLVVRLVSYLGNGSEVISTVGGPSWDSIETVLSSLFTSSCDSCRILATAPRLFPQWVALLGNQSRRYCRPCLRRTRPTFPALVHSRQSHSFVPPYGFQWLDPCLCTGEAFHRAT